MTAHMAEGEAEALPLLRRHFADREMADVLRRIRANPGGLQNLAWMLRPLSPEGQREFLRDFARVPALVQVLVLLPQVGRGYRSGSAVDIRSCRHQTRKKLIWSPPSTPTPR